MIRKVILEPAAQELCNATIKPPLIFQLSPEKGRETLEHIQDSPVYKYPAAIRKTEFDTGRWGGIPVYYITPLETQNIKRVIFYIHGAGWVFGSFHTHEKLVRELAARTDSLVVFPEYSRAPEAKYPTAIEQCYCVLCDVPKEISVFYPQIDRTDLLVAGDSVGGNMAAAMTFMARERQGPKISGQILYYPVTDDYFYTKSYLTFANDYYLYRAGMIWFWQQYAPLKSMRCKVTASPFKATIDLLKGLPPALLINGEADVLLSEGVAYGKKLRAAGVPVTAITVQGIIHDFVMLNALDQTLACRAAMNLSVDWINQN